MLLLPGTVLDAAVTFAERVRKQVEAHTFTFDGHVDSPHGELRRFRVAAPAHRRTAMGWCARPTMRCTSPRKPAAIASCGSTATSSTSTPRRKMDQTQPRGDVRLTPRPVAPSPTQESDGRDDELSPAACPRSRAAARARPPRRDRRHPAGNLVVTPFRRHSPGDRPQAGRRVRPRPLRDLPVRRAERSPPRRELRGSDDPEPRRRPQSVSRS